MESSGLAAPGPSETTATRVLVGGIVISFLGISFGMALVIAGSFLTWKSDPVLGLFGQSGMHVVNLTGSDGIISLVLGCIGLPALVLGAVLKQKYFYLVALVCSILLLVFSAYEVMFMATRTGVVGPGHGLYLIMGAGVAAFLCSLGGYLMMSANDKRLLAVEVNESDL